MIRSEIFAEQLCHLSEIKQRISEKDGNVDGQATVVGNVSNPNFVTQWLIGAASNRSSRTSEFPIISKKMRDEPGYGFRRSGQWITMKVLLQLGLTIALDSASIGKYIYKLIMLKFMGKMCNFLCDYSDASMHNDTLDTAVEMLAKIARRIDKLTAINNVEHTQSIIDLTTEIKGEAVECISKVRRILDSNHKSMQRLQMKMKNYATKIAPSLITPDNIIKRCNINKNDMPTKSNYYAKNKTNIKKHIDNCTNNCKQ